MGKHQFATPVIVSSETHEPLKRVPLHLSSAQAGYDEKWVQKLVFDHPGCLPIAEIDASYTRLIPVCRELKTPAGPIDVLYATPEGRLVLLEAKLWRNPESRRKVVGQILDYAKELSRWTYEDLQREVSRATGESGNALYASVAASAEVDEAQFVDEVSRSIRSGEFLLLVVGDGIREGVGAIAEFLQSSGTLGFTFGLVELAIYRMPDACFLVCPRVLAQTTIIKRAVISIQGEGIEIVDDGEGVNQEAEPTELGAFYLTFWTEFLDELKLDDVRQKRPNAASKGNIGFALPPSGSMAWLTVYFSQKLQEAGVFLTFKRGQFADHAYEALSDERSKIDTEIEVPTSWSSNDGKYEITASLKVDDLRSDTHRDEIKGFLSDRVNRFVNVFRPRLEKLVAELK